MIKKILLGLAILLVATSISYANSIGIQSIRMNGGGSEISAPIILKMVDSVPFCNDMSVKIVPVMTVARGNYVYAVSNALYQRTDVLFCTSRKILGLTVDTETGVSAIKNANAEVVGNFNIYYTW